MMMPKLMTIDLNLIYLIENEDEIKKAFPDRVTDNEYIFIYDRGLTPNEITLNVEWLD